MKKRQYNTIKTLKLNCLLKPFSLSVLVQYKCLVFKYNIIYYNITVF